MKTMIDKEITTLTNMMLDMVDLVSEAFVGSIDALEKEDYHAAKIVSENDLIINEKEAIIGDKCLSIIATFAPKAIDLRTVTGYIKINDELERVGDYAKKLSRMVSKTSGNKLKIYFKEIKHMVNNIVDMLAVIKESLKLDDANTAYGIVSMEEEIDETFKELVKLIIGNKDLSQKETINLILVSKELERSGDHLVNICENIIFIIKGRRVELE